MHRKESSQSKAFPSRHFRDSKIASHGTTKALLIFYRVLDGQYFQLIDRWLRLLPWLYFGDLIATSWHG